MPTCTVVPRYSTERATPFSSPFFAAAPGCTVMRSARTETSLSPTGTTLWPPMKRATKASGFVNPAGALVIGIAAGLLCYWGATSLKLALR